MLIRGMHRYTGTQTGWRSHKPTSIFSERESRLKTLRIITLLNYENERQHLVLYKNIYNRSE
jgi:hypothetical protein